MDEVTEINVPEIEFADIFERGDYLQVERSAWTDGKVTYRARKRSTRYTDWGGWYDSDKEGWPRKS